GGQGGENERLQQVDQQLEAEDEEHHRERAGREEQSDGQSGQVPAREHEDEQQQVPGEHVREQPDAQGERLDDEEPEQLDRDQDDQDGLGHVPGDHVLDVAGEPLVLEPQVQVEKVDDEHERPDEADPGHGRELEDRYELHQVH